MNTPTQQQPPKLTDAELFVKYQSTKVFDTNGKLVSTDLTMRNELATRNAPLVTYVVNKFYNTQLKRRQFRTKSSTTEMREEMLQEGHIGLLDAIDGYKPELGFKFSTYAVWWIRQAVNSYLLEDEPLVRVPAHVRTAKNELRTYMKERGIVDVDAVNKPDALSVLGITDSMLDSAMLAIKMQFYRTVRLDEPVGQNSASSMGGAKKQRTLMEDGPTTRLEGLMDTSDEAEKLTLSASVAHAARKSLDNLTPRELAVLLERFGIDSTPILVSNS